MSREPSAAQKGSSEPDEPNYARYLANWIVVLPPGFGLLMGLMATFLYGSLPGLLFAGSGLGVGIYMLAQRGRALRYTRTALTAGMVAVGYLALCFVGMSASAAYVIVAPWAGGALLVVGTWLVLLATHDAVPRRLAQWDAQKAHNLGPALDLATAQYSFGAERGFRYGGGSERSSVGRLWTFAGAAAAVAAGLPVLFPARGPSHIDARTYLVLFAGLPVAVAFAPVLATAWVNMRKVTEYEDELGRPITNR